MLLTRVGSDYCHGYQEAQLAGTPHCLQAWTMRVAPPVLFAHLDVTNNDTIVLEAVHSVVVLVGGVQQGLRGASTSGKVNTGWSLAF